MTHGEAAVHGQSAEMEDMQVDDTLDTPDSASELLSLMIDEPSQRKEAVGVFSVFLASGATRDLALRKVCELYSTPRVTAELSRKEFLSPTKR